MAANITDPKIVGNTLEGLVAASPTRRLKGPVLAQQLRSRYPFYDFRLAAGMPMSTFINVHAPRLQRDLQTDEYSLRDGESARAVAPAPAPVGSRKFVPPQVWFAFSSGAGKDRVALHASLSELKASPRDEELAEGWQEIKSMTTEEHREIALEFARIKSLDNSIVNIINSPSPNWYRQLFSVLDQELKEEWRQFHNDKVLQQLGGRVQGFGVDLEKCRVPWSMPSVDKMASAQGTPPHTSRMELRRIAMRLIETLGEDELRTMKFELGAVLDAIRDVGF